MSRCIDIYTFGSYNPFDRARQQHESRIAMPLVVRTVRGDVEPSELGPTDAHEHLFFVTPIQPGDEGLRLLDGLVEVGELVAAGGRTLVDWTPLGLGRDPEGLLRVSEATGLHVVAATGVHRDAHYLADD